MGQLGQEHLLALSIPTFPRKLSWGCLPEKVFCKGWDLDLMEILVLLYQPASYFLP